MVLLLTVLCYIAAFEVRFTIEMYVSTRDLSWAEVDKAFLGKIENMDLLPAVQAVEKLVLQKGKKKTKTGLLNLYSWLQQDVEDNKYKSIFGGTKYNGITCEVTRTNENRQWDTSSPLE